MWSLDPSLKSCPGIKLLLNPPYFFPWHQGTLILFCCSSPLLFIEVQIQKRLRSMSQSIIISKVVLDPLRISFTLGQSLPDTVFRRTLIGSQESRGQGSRVSTSLSFGDGSVLFFSYVSIFIAWFHRSVRKRQSSFRLIRAPRVNEPLLLCPQEINKSFNHSETGKVSAC